MAHTTSCNRVFEDHNEDDVKNKFLHQMEKAEEIFVFKFLNLKDLVSKVIHTELTAVLGAIAYSCVKSKSGIPALGRVKCLAKTNRAQGVLLSSWGRPSAIS
jgi:hypothetical protein